MTAVSLRRAAAVTLAAGAALALLSTAAAASDLRVTFVDCQGHPRRITIVNSGDSAQDLIGWKLQSDLPGQEFDLGPTGTLGAGGTVYVFNGHGAPEAPELVGDEWIYPWNPGSFDFALWEDGKDFIQIVDAGGNVVSNKPCPIPPVTPAPQPTQPPGPQATQPPTDTNTGGSNTPDSTQPGGAVQNVPGPSNTGARGGTQSAGQARGTSAEVFGPPLPPGAEAPLPAGGGPPLAEQSLPLALMSVLAGVVAMLAGVLTIGLALRRPE